MCMADTKSTSNVVNTDYVLPTNLPTPLSEFKNVVGCLFLKNLGPPLHEVSLSSCIMIRFVPSCINFGILWKISLKFKLGKIILGIQIFFLIAYTFWMRILKSFPRNVNKIAPTPFMYHVKREYTGILLVFKFLSQNFMNEYTM